MNRRMTEPSDGGNPNAFITFLCSIAVLVVVAISYHKLDRNFGKEWVPHVVYWGIAALVVGLVTTTTTTTNLAACVFSNLTVTVLGMALPIYESVRAVCSPEEDDDKAWLEYWLVGGVLFIATTWVDDDNNANNNDALSEKTMYWNEFMSFALLWLYFPKTDGAVLIYDKITLPHIAPRIRPLAAKMNNFIAYLYQTLINAAHLWFLWIIFLFLPKGLKRMISVCIGTVYPLVSSITAAATEDIEDDTYWLTYWSVYGCLFLLMDILETWIGWIPGFYTVVILATVYLMLPMFQGADKVFRKILVPLAGLQELLMLRDAISIKKAMLKDLDPERAKTVRKAIAKFYAADDDDASADPAELKKELLTSWQGIQLPALPSFSFRASSSEPTETTSLV